MLDIEKLRVEFEELTSLESPHISKIRIRGVYIDFPLECKWQGFQSHAALQEAKPELKTQISRKALTEFCADFCLGKSELVAMAESAFYWFNKCLVEDNLSAAFHEAKPESAVAKKPFISMIPMEYDDGRIGWYFDCDDFYADIDKDADGKYSIFFRDRNTQEDAFADQAEPAAEIDYSIIFDMEVSMDVSQGDSDSGRRIFGRVEQVIPGINGKHIIIAVEESRNFTEAAANGEVKK